MKTQISMAKSKRRLATVWFGGSGFLFFLFLVQTVLGKYRESTDEAWGWLLGTFMPTLSLIIGVLVLDALGKGVMTRTVDRFMFRLTFSLSIGYLLAVALMILLSPFSPSLPLELMQQSSLWLSPLQGLVSAALGVFFIRGAQGSPGDGHVEPTDG